MAAIAVVVAVLAALTLLPAMLAIAGRRINSLRVAAAIPRRGAARSRALWARWAAGVATPTRCVAGARRAGDPDPAGDPAAVADARPAGRRRALDVDHRPARLRPALRELRARRERAAAGRGHARLAGEGLDRSRARTAAQPDRPARHRPAAAAERRLDRRRGRGGHAGPARQGRARPPTSTRSPTTGPAERRRPSS